ncbi:MAG: sulfatase-like hydrolase/transferase, partial [Bacteroidales bacterium]|nr:sulfatase-like hydrolase/transferase [Bacteroidales bacterium]
MVLVDDLGCRDVGYNSEMYQTPYINELASKSLIFNEAYSSASNGLATRASIFTGLYPTRHGVYTTGSSARGYKPAQSLIPVKNKSKLSYKFNTISRIAKSAGYKTALIGKWGLNNKPLKCGFDTNIAGSLLNSPYSHFSPYNLDNIINGPLGENLTERLTTEAMNFIEKYK